MGAIAAVGLAGLAAACSSSSSTVSGTEHVYGKVTGKALAILWVEDFDS